MNEPLSSKRKIAAVVLTAAAIILPIMEGCDHRHYFGKSTEMNPCDPVSNIYDEEGRHFIERGYVKEDGTIDYKKWFESRKAGNSPCDPLKKKRDSVEEQLKKTP